MNCSTLKQFFRYHVWQLYNFNDIICDAIFSNFVVMKEIYHPNTMDLGFTNITCKKKKVRRILNFSWYQEITLHSNLWNWWISFFNYFKYYVACEAGGISNPTIKLPQGIGVWMNLEINWSIGPSNMTHWLTTDLCWPRGVSKV